MILRSLVGLWLLGLVAASHAQESLALAQKRLDYQAALKRASTPVDGAYVRSLRTLREKLLRAGDAAGVQAVDKEIHAVLTGAGAAALAGTAPPPMNKMDGPTSVAPMASIEIISAHYGSTRDQAKVLDISATVINKFLSGTQYFMLSTRDVAEAADPAPGEPKQTVIAYLRNGVSKEKTFPENHTLDFKRDLD